MEFYRTESWVLSAPQYYVLNFFSQCFSALSSWVPKWHIVVNSSHDEILTFSTTGFHQVKLYYIIHITVTAGFFITLSKYIHKEM